jgi:sugar diacid utilization regulator
MAGVAIEISDVLGRPAGTLRTPEPTSGYALLFGICCELQAAQGDLADVTALIVEKTAEVLGSDVAWVSLRDEATGELQTVAARGVRDARLAAPDALSAATLGAAPRRTLVWDARRPGRELPAPLRCAMAAEGIHVLACAPMLRDDVLVGAVYTGMRTAAAFGSVHGSMLSTLAEHGSIAIHNGRLLEQLAHQNRLLQKSFAIHRRVTATGLREAGTGNVVQTLAQLLERRIAIEGSEPTGDAVAGRAAILAGDETLGEVVAYGEPLTELEQHALEHGATLLAAELLRQRSAREAEWRLQGELLEELVEAPWPPPESLRDRARHAGVDLARTRYVFVVEDDEHTLGDLQLLHATRALVSRRSRGVDCPAVLAFQRGQRLVVGVPAVDGLGPVDLAAALQSELRQPSVKARIGVSQPTTDLHAAHRGARACARLAASRPCGSPVVTAASLGPYACLLDAEGFDQAEAMVREYLAGLARHDRTGRVPLLETVAAFVASGGHVALAAERCYVHVTTLKYRLGLAAEHLPRSLDDLDLRFELRVAFRVLELLEALGRDPLGRRVAHATSDAAAAV